MCREREKGPNSWLLFHLFRNQTGTAQSAGCLTTALQFSKLCQGVKILSSAGTFLPRETKPLSIGFTWIFYYFIYLFIFDRKRRTRKRTAAVKIHPKTNLSDSTLSAERMTFCTGFHGNRAMMIYCKHLRPGLTRGSIFRCKKMRPNLILVRLMRTGSVWWFISSAARLCSSEDRSSLAKLVKLPSLQTLKKYLLQHCVTPKIFPESFHSFADAWKCASWYNYGRNETAQARLELWLNANILKFRSVNLISA